MTDDRDDFDARLDGALRARFGGPALETVVAATATAAARREARRTLVLGSAATLIFGLALGFGAARLADGVPHAGEPAADVPNRWIAAYAHALASDACGENCCAADADLARECAREFGRGLAFADGAAVQSCARFCGERVGGCVVFMARAGGERRAVFVCPREADPRPEPGSFPGLTLHRRELGELVAYELSRRPEAGVLPHLIAP